LKHSEEKFYSGQNFENEEIGFALLRCPCGRVSTCRANFFKIDSGIQKLMGGQTTGR
jgi:hypothetical protein